MCAFVPSVFWGILYSLLIKSEKGASRILIALLFGSVIALIIYNYFLVYLPFVAIYSAFFLVLLLAEFWESRSLRFV